MQENDTDMAFDITLNLPTRWQKESDTYIDESGAEISHLEAHLYNRNDKRDEGMIDVYVGEMPEDTTAEDQAFSNYADMVGFSDDDPEDFQPIFKVKFNGKNAFGFEALCEDDSPMKFFTQEIKKGVLAIFCIAGKDEKTLDEIYTVVERNFRIR